MPGDTTTEIHTVNLAPRDSKKTHVDFERLGLVSPRVHDPYTLCLAFIVYMAAFDCKIPFAQLVASFFSTNARYGNQEAKRYRASMQASGEFYFKSVLNESSLVLPNPISPDVHTHSQMEIPHLSAMGERALDLYRQTLVNHLPFDLRVTPSYTGYRIEIYCPGDGEMQIEVDTDIEVQMVEGAPVTLRHAERGASRSLAFTIKSH